MKQCRSLWQYLNLTLLNIKGQLQLICISMKSPPHSISHVVISTNQLTGVNLHPSGHLNVISGCLKGSVRPWALFDCAAQLMMVCVTLNVLFLMLSLCSPSFINTENANVQEKLFLSSMGLSSRPKPSHQAPVPSLLWKMFKKSTKQTSTSHSDPCLVSEYGVRGNIVRFIQDQGEAFSVWVNLTMQYIISPWLS